MKSTRPDTSESTTLDVAVVARNGSGATEIVVIPITLATVRYHDGMHYDIAKNTAAEQGYEPVHAFDDREPAFQAIRDGRKYRRFFDACAEGLQDCLVEGREVSGADTIDRVSNIFGEFPDETLYVGVSPADGFWRDTEGFTPRATWATLYRAWEPLTQLRAAAPVIPIAIPVSRLNELQGLPEIETFQEVAAEVVASRGELREEDAEVAELLRRALKAPWLPHPCSPPSELFDPLLVALVRRAAEACTSIPRYAARPSSA